MWIKQTALLFTLVYLFSTGLIMVRAEGHALSHEEHAEDHAKQHASFICTWMCAASTFVHTSEQTLDGQSTPSFVSPIAKPEAPPGRNPSPPGPSGLLLLSIPKLFSSLLVLIDLFRNVAGDRATQRASLQFISPRSGPLNKVFYVSESMNRHEHREEA
ncbi:MAG: hypothetical protein MPW17_19125 [Candidatus Manganitrophus sp.]|nr:MAG: hypothetical protein MPW17_19125 [Candidatus Manganitrophus sp.]